jgi:hypothetical protein
VAEIRSLLKREKREPGAEEKPVTGVTPSLN